jgi:hypothetical protein
MDVLANLTLLLYLVFVVGLALIPILALVWIARTLAAIRRQNAAMLRLLTALATDVRVASMRERHAKSDATPP